MYSRLPATAPGMEYSNVLSDDFSAGVLGIQIRAHAVDQASLGALIRLLPGAIARPAWQVTNQVLPRLTSHYESLRSGCPRKMLLKQAFSPRAQ